MDSSFVNQIKGSKLSERQEIYACLIEKQRELEALLFEKKRKLKLCQLSIAEAEVEMERNYRKLCELREVFNLKAKNTIENSVLEGSVLEGPVLEDPVSRRSSRHSAVLENHLIIENRTLKAQVQKSCMQLEMISDQVLETLSLVEKVNDFLSIIDKLKILELDILEIEDINNMRGAIEYSNQH